MSVPLLGQPDTAATPGPMIRVLYCKVCDTLEEIPPYYGNPDHDTLLKIVLEHHVFPSGDAHVGRLFVVPVDAWVQTEARQGIIKQIKGGAKGLADIDESFYDTKDTFREDAMKCWIQHNRTTNCPDYESESKRLLPDTKGERKDAGLASPKNAPGPRVYLCYFCPYHSIVAQRRQKAAGAY